jgi:very-short-patch-repair endonuclease
MNNARDWGIVQNELWYRVPVATAPKRWPPQWLAFYHTKEFGSAAYSIQYYGRVREISVVERRLLLPHEPPNPKSERQYYRVRLERLEQLADPIRSARWRRIVFIPTTWDKFVQAQEVNDLFDESPLEDLVWSEFKKLQIGVERQWELITDLGRSFLDFAIFCAKGSLDVETDGDTWHAARERIPKDNQRDNAVQAVGWRVLRFNGQQVREAMADYCLPPILQAINTLGGPKDHGLVPPRFATVPEGTVQQLNLFEGDLEYEEDGL